MMSSEPTTDENGAGQVNPICDCELPTSRGRIVAEASIALLAVSYITATNDTLVISATDALLIVAESCGILSVFEICLLAVDITDVGFLMSSH